MSGTSADRLSRLLALVPWLMARDGVTLAQCAEHFGVSEEQLDLDLWLLVVCGVPGYGPDQLVDIQFWDDGRIHVLDPQTLGRPLRLSQEEALTLLVALRMLAQVPGVEDREAIVSAAVKLERAASATDADREIAVQVAVEPGRHACRRRRAGAGPRAGHPVRLRHEGRGHRPHDPAPSPLHDRRGDVPRGALPVRRGGAHLQARPRRHGPPGRYVRRRRSRRASGRRRGPARARQNRALLSVDPAASGVVDVHQAAGEEPGAPVDGGTLVRLPLHSLDWGVRLVLSLRGSARVLEPPELVDAVADAAASALAAYPDAVR